MEVIQKKIQEAITDQGVSLAALAHEWGISRQAVHQLIYQPWVRPPKRLLQLGKILGLTAECEAALLEYHKKRREVHQREPSNHKLDAKAKLQALVPELERLLLDPGTKAEVARTLGWPRERVYRVLQEPTFMTVVAVVQALGMDLRVEFR